MTMDSELIEKFLRAKAASLVLLNTPDVQKNLALNEISKALFEHADELRLANQKDLERSQEAPLVELEPLDAIVREIFSIMELPDPNGDVFDSKDLPNELKLTKYRIPMGHIGLVLDQCPERVITAAALSIKSGNTLLIWAEKAIEETVRVLVRVIQMGLEVANLPLDIVQMIRSHEDKDLMGLLEFKEGLDLILVRANPSIIEFCEQHGQVPLLYEKRAICHAYVDQLVNIEKAINVVVNAKVQKPKANNSISTVLIHESIAVQFIPLLFKALEAEEVAFRLDSTAWNYFISLGIDTLDVQMADPQDWDKAWSSKVLNVKIVSQIDQAIEHIQQHGTGHCECILSDHPLHAMIFTSYINASAIVINTSTRFYEGTQMELGPEILSSSQKAYSNGPVGVKELMAYKWLIQGNYQIRD